MGKVKKKRVVRAAYKKKYTQDSVEKALTAIKGGMSLRKAADTYGVPKSTLQAKNTNKIPVEAIRGPSTYLTTQEEEVLVNWILYCGERGFPVTKCQLLESVQKLMIELERENPFKDNKPGRHWFESFCRRHPQVSERVCQNLSLSRVSATEDKLRSWFQEVREHLEPLNLINIGEGVKVLAKGEKVLAKKGSQAIYKVVHGDDKESLTVLFTVSANGIMLPPMILFWYERIPANITRSLPSEWIAGTTERGWMTADCFYKYVKTIFHPWLVKKKITFPVLLYMDGHSSHLTLELSKFCREKRIELIALYPNATHILQPLDVAVFSPLKKFYKKTVDKWRIDNVSQRVTRETFAPVLKKSIDALENLPIIIRNGFETCGLLPFSPERVSFDILNNKKKKLERTNGENTMEKPLNECSQNESRKHLQFFEDTLRPEDLQNFKSALENNATISRENKGLFEYWMGLRNLSG